MTTRSRRRPRRARCNSTHEFAKRVQALKQEWLEKAGNPRPQSGVSPEAARQALNRLEAAGVLQNISAGKRNRAFETVGLFALLDAFGTRPRAGRTRPDPFAALKRGLCC